MLIQLDHLAERGVSRPFVREIVSQFLTELAEHKFARIAPELNISPQSDITPDVVITRGDGGFEVDVVESHRFARRVNPMYTRLAADLRCCSAAMSPEERQDIQWYTGRAKLFIANVFQRRQTMFKITRCIVERQRAYLEHGIRSLQPLSRASIAQQIGFTRARSAEPPRANSSCCQVAK